MSNSIAIQDPDKRMDIKPLNGYYVVVTNNGRALSWSISYQRHTCISAYAEGLGKSGDDAVKEAWKDAKKRGHRAVKVNMTFDPV